MVAQHVVFAILAATIVLGAARVVTTQNVVRAGLLLAVVLAAVGGIYLLLAAEFVFVTQVIVYIGAVVVLLLFGTMLTRAPIGRDVRLDNEQRWLAVIVALFLAGVTGSILVQGFGRRKIVFPKAPNALPRAADIGNAILGPYIVPFEVVSILLLAALIGAVAVARRD